MSLAAHSQGCSRHDFRKCAAHALMFSLYERYGRVIFTVYPARFTPP